MLALITSCDRIDLLKKTYSSLFHKSNTGLYLSIQEDSEDFRSHLWPQPINGTKKVVNLPRIGQHKSIEYFMLNSWETKYYFHCEDDWEFQNTYDWISESVKIMEADPTIIKVLCRSDSPHTPKEFKDGFGYLEQWTSTDGILWRGFSWNPGVTRLDLLKQFVPFRKREQEVAEDIYKAGYRVAMLEKGVCRHIGDGRSTHS